MVIYKYPLERLHLAETELSLPQSHNVLHVGMDSMENLCVWIELDKSTPYSPRKFLTTWTGQPIETHVHRKYVGSAVDCVLVFHVFEV